MSQTFVYMFTLAFLCQTYHERQKNPKCFPKIYQNVLLTHFLNVSPKVFFRKHFLNVLCRFVSATAAALLIHLTLALTEVPAKNKEHKSTPMQCLMRTLYLYHSKSVFFVFNFVNLLFTKSRNINQLHH